MSAVEKPELVSFEEYLRLEKESEGRHEYYRGEVFALAGSTRKHNKIAGNVYTSLLSEVKGKDCDVFIESIKLELEANSYYVYPDVVLDCGEEEDPYLATNPVLVVEVLSESTEKYDRGKKFESYLKLASIKYYVLISQDKVKVEVFTKRDPRGWLYDFYEALEDRVELPELGIGIRLEEVYAGVNFI